MREPFGGPGDDDRQVDGQPKEASASHGREDRPEIASKRRLHWSARWCLLTIVLLIGLAAAVVGLIEAGTADRFLAARAQAGLQQALGAGVDPQLDGAKIRLTGKGNLKLEARGVTLREHGTNDLLASARTIDIRIAPWALLSGRISVSSLDVDGVKLDPSAFGSDQPVDFNSLRVDDVGRLFNAAFAGADRFFAVLKGGNAKLIRITDTTIIGTGDTPLAIRELTLRQDAAGKGLRLTGTLAEGNRSARIDASAGGVSSDGKIQTLSARVSHFDTTPFLVQKAVDGTPALGISTFIDLSLNARRGGAGHPPSLQATINLAPGQFYADGTPAEIKSGTIKLAYRYDRGSIEIQRSEVRVGESVFPFDGGIIDLSNLKGASGSGFAFDLVMNGASAEPLDSDEPRLPFNGKIFAKYLKDQHHLVVQQLAIATPLGSLAGSLDVTGAEKSPQFTFAARIDKMQTTAVKQLWPYWLAVHARQWMLNNLYGGTITNASIKVFVPKNKIAESAGNMDFGPDDLQIDFDYAGARLDVAGDIPPLRETTGHLKLRGKRLDVLLNSATAFFPTGRQVEVSDGRFSIPDTDKHPLMAELDIKVDGKAAAVGELVSYKPIDALERTDYKPSDFTAGTVTSHVQAVFGLLQEQNPPPPVWTVDAKLHDVDLGPKVDGHDFRNLSGTLTVDQDKAVLDTDAQVDGFPMHLDLTAPFGKDSKVQPARVITARLGDAAREKLLPGVNSIVDGPIDVKMTRTGDGQQSVSVDLTDATVTVPGLAWTKGAGIAAKSTFDTTDDGKVLKVNDFTLSGSGFSAAGSLKIANGDLTSAHFSSVKLSDADNFSVDVNHSARGYDVAVDGKSIDLRPLIKGVKKDEGATGKPALVSLKASVDTAYGFNKEKMGNLNLSYTGRGNTIISLDLKAVTDSGEAVVAKARPSGGVTDVTLSCGDAGSLARFADIYNKLRGGLLNVRLTKSSKGPYRGSVDLRNFSVDNENRLDSIVNDRPSRSGRSLRETVQRPINLKQAEFQRAFAQVELGSDYLIVSDGVLRGVQIGSTFQGTVYDSKGRMNLTGTFMPAYGLNKLFADVPIVGAILGNGRDRGLIGITYRLTGKVSSPKVEVNPLSVIAPGIFRQIFEY